MNHKKLASKPVRLLCLYVVTALFIMLTNPVGLPSVLLIIPFVLVFFCLYLSILAIIDFFRSAEDQTVVGLKFRRPRLLAAVTAGFPVLLLVLQSIVQLTIWDVAITLVIFLLVYMYVSRSNVTFLAKNRRDIFG
jgi:hypothetical protein